MGFSWFTESRDRAEISRKKAAPQSDPEILEYFDRINRRHFDGFLEAPVLRWNSRLRSSAGRFIPGSRSGGRRGWGGFAGVFHVRPPVIEVASYLKKVENAEAHIEDTIAHEMIHYWLWVRRRAYGHSPEFHVKMKVMGVSRYNPVPRTRPPRWVYGCGTCGKEFFSRRKLGVLACAPCCRRHAGGRFDSRFVLTLLRGLSPAEGAAHCSKTAHAAQNTQFSDQSGPGPR